MLRVKYLINYFKKEKTSPEKLEGIQHVKQIASQRKTLRFKRSDDDLGLPKNFKVGKAIADGNCFFDSFRQVLKEKLGIEVTVTQLREYCKEFAQNSPPEWFINAIANNHDNSGAVRNETPASYMRNILNSDRWGDPDIEGRILCKKYNVKLHVVERQVVNGEEIWVNQIVDNEGSRSVDNVDYNEENTIHIINRGNAHFESILSAQEIRHNKQQPPDPSDYDDEITSEEELINIIKSRDSEEEKLAKIERLFEKEPKPDINFQDKDNDTPLHIAIRKKELKVIEWLVKNGAKIDIKNSRGRTQLEVAQHLDRQDIVEVLKSHIQPSLQVSVERPSTQQKRTRIDSKEDKSEDSSHKRPRTSLQAAEESRGRKRTQNEENELGAGQVKKLKTSEGYPASGLKHTLHGNVYQLKLLMLFLKRGLNKSYSFLLATEMDAAEKFDDLVFKYESERKDGRVYRFLQAKHKQDESKKISVNDLLTEKDEDFSLQKYFLSYRKIKRNPEFNDQSDELKDFIICTNIDLGHDLQNSFERVEDDIDDIIDIKVENNSKEPKRLKFRKGGSLTKESLTSIFVEVSDLKRLAKKLAEYVFGNNNNDKTIGLKDDLLKKYHGALAERVIDIQIKKFKEDFVSGSSNLPKEVKEFRKVLLEKSRLSEEDFKRDLKTKNLKISGTFGKVLKLEENPQIKSSNKSPNPSQELGKHVANLIAKEKIGTSIKIEQRANIIKENIAKLIGHVFVETEDGKKKFRQGFLNGDTLPGNLNDFREGLKTGLLKGIQFSHLGQYEFEINVHTCTEKDYEEYKKDKYYFELPIPNDKIRDEEIDDFLDKLVFAVNQPNEVELGEIIKNELGKEFNTIDRKNVYGRFLEKILDWMKDKEGKFFTHEEGKTFFEEIKKEILGAIWFNMKDPVTLFTGRKRELSDLHKALQRNQGKDKFTVISQMTSISGLGGIGKSELARKYAYDHENDYDGNVIWINAENYDTLGNSFLNLARDNRLGIPTKDRDGKEKTVEATVKEIYVFFAKRKSLFIFDNAEKNDDLSKFLPLHDLPPNANKPYVLITSRNREWEKVIEVIDLSGLKLEDAIEFVKKGLGISEGDESQDQEIKNLVEKLQRFPLAIQQAIAYIEDQRVTGEFSIDDYLEEYKEKTEDLLNSEVFNGIDNGYAKTTCTTWKITIDKIASDKEHGELALEVLNTIAYFAAENINREIFLGLAGGDEVKLKSGVRLLVKYSMVNGEQKQSLLSIHRLVQQVTRINVKDREKEILRKVLGLLRDNINKYGVDHPMSVWSYASSHNELVKEFSSLPRMVIDELYCNMKYSKASSFEEEALKSLEKVLGDKHPEFLIMKRYRANAYGDSGNYEEKRRLLEDEVLPILRQSYQESPIEIARTLRNLGVVYGDLSDHEKEKDKKNKLLESRKKYLEEARKIFEECLGNDSIEVAKVKRNLANAYGDSDNYEKKRKLLEDEVLPVFKEYYGYDHLEVAKAKRNLANAYGDLNRYEKKRKLLEDEVLPILEKYYESDHVEAEVEIEFAKAKRNLGNVYRKLYRKLDNPQERKRLLEDGEKLLKEAFRVLKRYFGLSSEIVTKTKNNLKKIRKDLNGFKEDIFYGDEVLAEECLSGSSYRRKREAESECLFTWEDVDKFNTEKDEKRDFDKVNINSEKFVSYIKDLPEGKRSQLIQLADKVKVIGESQSLVNKLINNQKVISHLNRVGKISGMTMHGMMAKNVLADFLNGNYQGVAINVGFIAGGQGFAKVAEAASIKGLKLASEGKLLLGRSLRAASPFLARGTSAFVVYDLVNQVKAFKNGTEEALVGVVGDSIYLGVDAAEIGVEVAEAFGVLEGVSSVTGPIGAAIGAVVFVGTDIYMAVKRVDKIDEIIHLTGKERFVEGLRAFIGMQPEEHIQELLQEKQVSNQLVRQGLEYLKQHGDIQSYVFSTGKSVVDSCRKVPYKTSTCASGGFGGGCLRASTVTRYAEECTTKFEVDLDNTVQLDRKRTDIKWSRAKPDNPSGGELFCLPRGNHERVPSYGSYLCENAIGITDLSAKTGNHTLINLGEGTDHAKGFIDSPNIFVVNNGSKRYFGGNKDDIFILQGSSITGYFYGEGGVNTLDLTSFAPEEGSIDVKLHIGQVEDYYRKNFFGMSGINKFLGRKAKADQVFITCDSDTSDVKFVDGQSGSEEFVDHINIHDKDCAYEMQVVVRPNTVIYNRALKGDFHYVVPYALGSAKVDFIYTAEALNLNNTFAFEYEPAQIKNVDVRNINVLNKTSHIITFNFSPMSDKEFNITISGASNPSYRLGNNTEIKVGNKGNLYMLENTNKSVDEIIKDYLVVANRLNRMSFFIQSLLSNETVAIGSGNYEVIHNNPLHKSHLVGNGGENVYVIDSKRFKIPLPEVVIYDLDVESSVDTIDLRNLVQQARGKFSNSFKLQVLKSANDLLLKATVEKSTGDSSISEKHEYFTVRLKDGVNWYNKTHVIMDNVPMRISLDNNEWSLKPQPLMFEKDKEVIVVTSQDVEENTELITPKKAGNYTFVRDHGSDLIITNAFNTQDDLCTIVLSKFYKTPKMETLSIKFADKEIVLKDKQKEINTARYVDIVKREHKEQVYSDVFNRSPEVMLSDQPHRHQVRHRRSTSGSARPSSWINNLFGWVKSSIGGLLGSKSKETSSTSSPISQVDAKMDVNSTIMLLDVIVRKFTGKQYIPAVDQSIPLLEARGYALNITNRFEKVLNKTAIKSGISVTNLNFDPVVVQSAIIGKIINGKFSEIAKTLYSIAKEACPEFKQTDKFIDHLRSNLKEEKETAMLQQKVEKPYKDLSQEVSRKVQLSNKPDTFLNGTSVVQGISRAIN